MKKHSPTLVAARALALSVSIGTVGFLMLRAAGGCSNPSGAVPAPELVAPGPARSPSGPAVDGAGDEAYFPASKSMGGEGRRLLKPDAGIEEGRYFPGTKAPAGPMPPAHNPPPQRPQVQE